ncbi:MAG: M20 family metallopeptidase [Deltaproteobacteria bacterium]|nr:M20 family metallopeptidase [Deltaproteobacteria bacterium]MBW2361937.1 M20 family metallopeptidase [Deltaproteobacteria bacterium]
MSDSELHRVVPDTPVAPELAERVLAWSREQLEAMLTLLDQLVRIESPSHDADAQIPLLERVARELSELGYRTRHLPGRNSGGSLFARPAKRERGRPTQLLLGHGDTVWPLHTLEEMPAQVREGRMTGPGVYDMKAGLTLLIFALRALRELELEPPCTPLVLINTDEEIGSRESTPNIRRLARVVDRAFVLEPSLGVEGRLKTARKGVGRFTITVQGRAAHAGLDPEGGVSAILELSHVIQTLFALNDVERGITVNVGTIDGGLAANVVAPESRAVVDVRVRTVDDAQRIERAIFALEPSTPGATLNIEGQIGRPPMEPTAGNRALWETARRVGVALGLELEEATAGGGSDGNTTSLFVPTLDGLGAVGDGAHAPHEFVFTEKLVERGALLATLLLVPPLAAGGRTA